MTDVYIVIGKVDYEMDDVPGAADTVDQAEALLMEFVEARGLSTVFLDEGYDVRAAFIVRQYNPGYPPRKLLYDNYSIARVTINAPLRRPLMDDDQ